MRAHARVEEGKSGYTLALTLYAEPKADLRRFEADDCETLLELALLTYSMALVEQEGQAEPDPFEEDGELAPLDLEDAAPSIPELPPEGSEGQSPAPTDPAPSETPPPREEAPPTVDFEDPVDILLADPDDELETDDTPAAGDEPNGPVWGVRAHAGVGEGPLGPLTVPVGGTLVGGMKHWRITLGGVALLPRSVYADGDTSRGARLRGWMVEAGACGVLDATARLEIPLCGEIAGGLISGEGFGVDGPRLATVPAVVSSFSVTLSWRATSRIRPYASLSGGISVVRAGFSIEGDAVELFRAPNGQVGAELGVELRFGPLARTSGTSSSSL